MELTLDEVAIQLGKTVRQVRYLMEKGDLPARKVGGRWIIDSEDLPRGGAKKAAQERKERVLRGVVEDALELPKLRRRYSVTDLKAFQIALPLYRQAAEAFGLEHPATQELHRVLHLLAQGCHRFENGQKAAAYHEARDAASAAVCELVLAEGDEPNEIRQELEQDLMAAFAGLLRRLDRRTRGRR